MNGHTSGVSALGSDEKSAEKRRARRCINDVNSCRMRQPFERSDWHDDTRQACCRDCNEVGIRAATFRKWLRRQGLLRLRAATLVCATAGMTCFSNRRAGNRADEGRQSNRTRYQCAADQSSYGQPPHHRLDCSSECSVRRTNMSIGSNTVWMS